MAINVSTFITQPNSTADKVVYPEGKNQLNGVLLDYTVSSQWHVEPIFGIDDESVKAYENYKQADQYTGHSIRSNPDFSRDIGQSKYYVIEEDGKRFASGKTYYLGYETLLVPVI